MAVFKTDDFVLVDHTDQTKAVNFDASAATTGALKTFTFPNFGSATTRTFATQEGGNEFSGDNNFNFDTSPAITIHRVAGGSTADALTVESQVGIALFKINSSGYVVSPALSAPTIAESTAGLAAAQSFQFSTSGLSTLRLLSVPDVDGIMALDTSIVCYDGDVVTYDDDLVSI